MSFATYTALKANLATWLNRADLTAQIPDFIALCEAAVRRDLDAEGTTVVGGLSILSSQQGATPAPAGLRNITHLSLQSTATDGRVFVTTPDQVMYQRNRYGAVGTPRYVAIENGTLLFAPLPDTDYPATLIYDAALTSLSDTVATNWLLEQHPDVYLYGSLAHSAPFLKDDERLPVWKGLFDEFLASLVKAKQRAAYGANIPVGMPRKAF